MGQAAASVQIRSYGATELARFNGETHIVHCGNSKATENDNVRHNVDRLLGTGAFSRIRPFGTFLEDGAGEICSDPARKYILVVPNHVIDAF